MTYSVPGAGHRTAALMYHSVAPGRGTASWRWAVSLERFRDQLDRLAAHGYRTLTMQQLLQGGAGAVPAVAITFDDGYADNLRAVDELVKRGMCASWYVVTGAMGLTPHWPNDGRPAGGVLTSSDLRAMRAAGMEVGSHTCSHVRLPEVDDAALECELRDSRVALEDALGEAVTGFAYPYGAWDARCGVAVRAAGYAYALTTDTGWALRDGDPYRIRRLAVFNDDTARTLQRKVELGRMDVTLRHMAGYWVRRATERLSSRG